MAREGREETGWERKGRPLAIIIWASQVPPAIDVSTYVVVSVVGSASDT